MATYGVQPAMQQVNLGGYRAPAPVGGSLPFGSMGQAGNIPFGGNPQQLSQSYGNAYNSALALNQANYQNVLKGYQDAANAQAQRQHNTQTQHYELENQIRGDLNLAGSTRKQEIQDQYAQLSGQQSQQLIDRGLGNSTIQASVNRGLGLDEAKAQNQLAEQIAGLRAQYGSNLGLARIAQHAQGSREATGLTEDQLNFMNSVQSPYPDAGLYASLAQQYEQARAMEKASGSGYGFNPASMGGGVSYGPADPAFGRPSPGMFGGGSSYSNPYPTGGGYAASYAPTGPTGYAGGVPQIGGYGKGVMAADATSPRDTFSPPTANSAFTVGNLLGYGSGGGYEKQEAIY